MSDKTNSTTNRAYITLKEPEMQINKVIIKDKNGNIIEEIKNVNRNSKTR